MKRIATSILVLAIAGAALAAGYWWGSQKNEGVGMKSEAVANNADPAKKAERKILYYRNPMGLPDTSPTPKKDQMGMDYIPVYDGEEPEAGSSKVKISTDKVQKLGVKTEAAALRDLTRTVRAVGTIQPDERRIFTVAPKFEGWIEQLHINTTGQPVARGQALMEVYSPELVSAQQEYLIALKGVEAVKNGSPEAQANMRQLVSSALQRLRNWDISDAELNRLQKEGATRQTITLRSPVGGVVLEKPALKGMRFMPGEALYKISDLSSLWLLADIFEQDLALIRPGQAANIMVNAYPGKSFSGKVTFVYPTLTAETRTAKVRIELANPGGLLKPEMYANVELLTGGSKAKALSVPDSAVIDSGTRQVVLVQLDAGLFEPRAVKLGARADGYVEVLDGIKDGEIVVVSANFLIDSESNLKAALNTFGVSGSTPIKRDSAASAGPDASTVHKAQGKLEGIDEKDGTVVITHGPIPSLKWAEMTMEFQVSDRALLKGVKLGQNVAIDIVQRGPGEFVITRITPAMGSSVSATPAGAADHKGR